MDNRSFHEATLQAKLRMLLNLPFADLGLVSRPGFANDSFQVFALQKYWQANDGLQPHKYYAHSRFVNQFMCNGAQHGVACAAAVEKCIELNTSPRGLYERHPDALKTDVKGLTYCDHDLNGHPPEKEFEQVFT